MDAVATFQALIDRYLAAYEAHDAAGCAAFYAPDAEMHSPYGPAATGRAEIAATHRDWFEEGETNKVMQVTSAGIVGDLGYCLVRFEANMPAADGGTEQSRGISLNLMERRDDGVWTIALASLNELVETGTEPDR